MYNYNNELVPESTHSQELGAEIRPISCPVYRDQYKSTKAKTVKFLLHLYNTLQPIPLFIILPLLAGGLARHLQRVLPSPASSDDVCDRRQGGRRGEILQVG